MQLNQDPLHQPSTPDGFKIDHIGLRFDIGSAETQIVSRLHLVRVGDSDRVALSGPVDALQKAQVLGRGRLDCDSSSGCVVVTAGADELEVELTASLYPGATRPLTGLFEVQDVLCTQCEPQAFRRFAFAKDEPGARSTFTVEISAEEARFPSLISNGCMINKIRRGGKIVEVWEDLIPKPAYLFALAAGKFDTLSKRHIQSNGTEIELRIFTPKGRSTEAEFAMDALIAAVDFDNRYLGMASELAAYSMVAIEGYPQTGAESQGLSLFQAQSILIDPRYAVDSALEAIERSVAHEFFHGWTGVRVGIPDWHQLSLKEGLTVFREQRFIEERYGGELPRLNYLRRIARHKQLTRSKPTNSQALTYNSELYYQGASVIETLRAICGEEKFKHGLHKFLINYAGKSAVWEDLFKTICGNAEAHRLDLLPLTNELPQNLQVTAQHQSKQLEIRVARSNKVDGRLETNGKPAIPLSVALLAIDKSQRRIVEQTVPLWLKAAEIEHVSVLNVQDLIAWSFRGNALLPIRLQLTENFETDRQFAIHSPTAFSRALHFRSLLMAALIASLRKHAMGLREPILGSEAVYVLRRGLENADQDPGLASDILELPSVMEIVENAECCTPNEAGEAIDKFGKLIAAELNRELWAMFDHLSQNEPVGYDPKSRAKRMLLKSCMALLSFRSDTAVSIALYRTMQRARTVTTFLSAFEICLRRDPQSIRYLLDDVLARDDTAEFQERIAIVLARCSPAEVVADLAAGTFPGLRSPLRPLRFWNAFTIGNPLMFHADGGSGYRLVGKTIRQIDQENPIGSARLCRSFASAQHLPWRLRSAALFELESLLRHDHLSKLAKAAALAVVDQLSLHREHNETYKDNENGSNKKQH
jgi:aminopeptidase N